MGAGEASGAGAGTPAKSADILPYDPLRLLNLITIVFQERSPPWRRPTQVMEDFLKNEIQINAYVGVFTLRYRLAMLQKYTNRVDLLKNVVEEAGKGAYTSYLVHEVSKEVGRGIFQVVAVRGALPAGPEVRMARPKCSSRMRRAQFHTCFRYRCANSESGPYEMRVTGRQGRVMIKLGVR